MTRIRFDGRLDCPLSPARPGLPCSGEPTPQPFPGAARPRRAGCPPARAGIPSAGCSGRTGGRRSSGRGRARRRGAAEVGALRGVEQVAAAAVAVRCPPSRRATARTARRRTARATTRPGSRRAARPADRGRGRSCRRWTVGIVEVRSGRPAAAATVEAQRRVVGPVRQTARAQRVVRRAAATAGACGTVRRDRRARARCPVAGSAPSRTAAYSSATRRRQSVRSQGLVRRHHPSIIMGRCSTT